MFRNICNKIIKNTHLLNQSKKVYSNTINTHKFTNNYIAKRFMSSYFNENHDFIYFKENINEIEKLDKIKIKFGFSDYALEKLNNIVYAEYYKDVNDFIEKEDILINVESVKASIDTSSIVSGTITSLNQEFIENIQENSELSIEDIKKLNSYNEENGLTIFEIEVDNNEISDILESINNNELMNTEQYKNFLEE